QRPLEHLVEVDRAGELAEDAGAARIAVARLRELLRDPVEPEVHLGERRDERVALAVAEAAPAAADPGTEEQRDEGGESREQGRSRSRHRQPLKVLPAVSSDRTGRARSAEPVSL